MATITSPGPRRCLFFTFFGRLMSSWKSKTVPPQEVVKVSWNNRNKSLENTWAHLPFRIINLPSSPVLSPKKQWYTQKFKMIQSSDQNVIDRYGHCPVWTIQKCQKGRTEQLILLLSSSQTQAPFHHEVIADTSRELRRTKPCPPLPCHKALFSQQLKFSSESFRRGFQDCGESTVDESHTNGAFINKYILFVVEKSKP